MTTGAPRTAAHHSLISFVFLDALSFRPTQRVGPDPTRRPSARQGSVRPPHTQQQACCLVSSNSLNLSTLDLAECPDKNGLMQGCNVENKVPMWFGNETQGRHSGEVLRPASLAFMFPSICGENTPLTYQVTWDRQGHSQ
ncbi:hypothetical protein Pcinc_018410 [Petrolisthes cinctipes]|uniref:Uncharacterized protein n=1 Tax=Petrolisthes cinctipes TaxID=88211 RepID=A0AAE1FN54_PETCI|nr:hypothetical protein Pcinc_018410 [Petrolisthes cinctipes]